MPWPDPVIHIVDDDPVFTKFINNHIRSHGYKRIKSFGSGEDFLKSLKDNPSVVLLDFSLHGLNGMDILKQINKKKPRMKIVVITVINDPALEEECLKLGAVDYLVKEESRMEALKARVLDILNEAVNDKRRKYAMGMFAIIALVILIYLMSG